MKNIVLIGFMGSGKTSVGRELAEQKDLYFIDLDKKIEESSGLTIPYIFETEGETGFRKRETEALRALSNQEDTVISTGGGIVERPENKSILSECGTVIYLHASFEEIASRLNEDESRPLWKKPENERRELFEKRLPFYQGWADHVVETDSTTLHNVVNDIKALINS